MAKVWGGTARSSGLVARRPAQRRCHAVVSCSRRPFCSSASLSAHSLLRLSLKELYITLVRLPFLSYKTVATRGNPSSSSNPLPTPATAKKHGRKSEPAPATLSQATDKQIMCRKASCDFESEGARFPILRVLVVSSARCRKLDDELAPSRGFQCQ